MGVRGLQVNLLNQFAMQIGDNTPDMFLVDIQQDQAADMRAFLAQRLPKESQPNLIPSCAPVSRQGREPGRGGRSARARMLSREYTITYRGQLESNETLLKGTFPKPTVGTPFTGSTLSQLPGPTPGCGLEVSIEEGIVQRFGIDVGDVMRFDAGTLDVCQGQRHQTRRVARRSQRRFMFVFGAGTFEAARTGSSRPCAPTWATPRSGKFTHDLVVRFPNVSVIDLRELLESVRAVFQVVTVAIDVVGTLVILTGGLIPSVRVAVTNSNVSTKPPLKTLGASSRRLRRC